MCEISPDFLAIAGTTKNQEDSGYGTSERTVSFGVLQPMLTKGLQTNVHK
jgi:hypothetical protein